MANNRIKVVLAKRNMTAKSLADALGDECSPALISYICGGKVLPTRELLRSMCIVLSCSTEDLFDSNDLDLLSEVRENEECEERSGLKLGEEMKLLSKKLTMIAEQLEAEAMRVTKPSEVILPENEAD